MHSIHRSRLKTDSARPGLAYSISRVLTVYSQLESSTRLGHVKITLNITAVDIDLSFFYSTGTDYWREQFQTISEDVSVRNVLMHSAH